MMFALSSAQNVEEKPPELMQFRPQLRGSSRKGLEEVVLRCRFKPSLKAGLS